MREGTDKYDDGAKGGYTYAEKLALSAQGLMDPESIGLPKGDAGQKEAIKEITGAEDTKPKLGDFVTFEASTIPAQLRAHWARMELQVQPDGNAARDWEDKWVEDHKDEYAVQGTLHSGTCHSVLQRLYSDPIMGFVEMMRQAADLLEAKYNELKKSDPSPIIYRDNSAKISAVNEAPTPETGEQQAKE